MQGARTALVLTIAFVFASTSLLVEPATAQVGSTLTGRMCYQEGGYPTPVPMPASDMPEQAGCYGNGVPGAVVRLTSEVVSQVPVQERTADEGGYFAFDKLVDGTYVLTATSGAMEDFEQEIEIEGATKFEGMMTPRQIVQPGTVVDGKGNPIAGAQVTACCTETNPSATTDASGSFEVEVLGGHRSLEVRKEGFQVASQYLFLDGADVRFEMVPVPPADAYIRGTVRDQDGNAIAGVRLTTWGGCCYTMDGSTDSSQPYYSGEIFDETDALGKYELGVYQGYASVNAYKEGYAPRSFDVQVEPGQDQTRDVKLLKYPEKTARITGRVVDAQSGDGLRNLYININHPEFGLYTCSTTQAGGGSAGGSGGAEPMPPEAKPAEMDSRIVAPDYYPYPGCDITVDEDGSFEGTVTPGYAIISAYQDHWSSCNTTTNTGGSSSTSCGPEYLQFVRTMTLPAGETTNLRIELQRRPDATAIVSGYVVDAETQKAIPDARVSFYNQDASGWGEAVTDQDGSFKIALRPGYHTVSAYAERHLHWEGVLDVDDGNTAFDMVLTPGEEAYGYCCMIYAKGGIATAEAHDASSPTGGSSPPMMGAPASPEPDMASDTDEEFSEETKYEDLGGGLGPYDASKRQGALAEGTPQDAEGNDSPSMGLLLTLAVLGAAFEVLRRRKQA